MAEDLEEDYEENADADAASEEDGAPSGLRDKRKLILLVLLPLLLLVGGVTGAYFSGAADPVIEMVMGSGGEGEDDGRPAGPGVFYDLPDMLVNLNATGRKQSFLKIKVSLELESQADVARVQEVLPRIVDNFQVYLRELRIEDLQGAAGIYRLREELLARVSAAIAPARVRDVLFKEMLVQ